MQTSLELARVPNPTVAQHNDLIQHPIRMGLLEARIFVKALQLLRQGEDGTKVFPPIEIPVTDIIGSQDSAIAYKSIKAACEDLMSKKLDFTPSDAKKKRSFGYVNIMSSISHVEGSNTIRGTFSPDIAPFLLQLNSNYTYAEIKVLLTFRNAHSQRLYWILKSHAFQAGDRKSTTVEIPLDTLKNWMFQDTTIYPVYAEFKRNVLDTIFKEFHDKSVKYEASWEPVKTGKKVTAIKFKIPKDHNVPDAKELAPKPKATKADGISGFDSWLANLNNKKLSDAYAGLIRSDRDMFNTVTAQKMIRYASGKPTVETLLYKVRAEAATKAIDPNMKNFNRTTYILNAMKAVGFND